MLVQHHSKRLFILAIVVLMVTFILALIMFSVHYQLLTAELDAREQAERTVRDSEKSLRSLTGRLLQLQDEERRRFSRELHDSLGQYLAAVKMNLDMFSNSQPSNQLLSEAIHLLDQSIAETRTISHLLHPPLLDEAGFSSAAKWYLDGFAQRSGIAVKADLPSDMGRLPKPVELGLFRVLQESLTNIHRHSGSSRAEVALKLFPGKVMLEVRDFGHGIPPGTAKERSGRGNLLWGGPRRNAGAPARTRGSAGDSIRARHNHFSDHATQGISESCRCFRCRLRFSWENRFPGEVKHLPHRLRS